tara:strand:- start:312 stop:485 length:174 start_codon:yes stop_codon:yes gene_type:complete
LSGINIKIIEEEKIDIEQIKEKEVLGQELIKRKVTEEETHIEIHEKGEDNEFSHKAE